MSPLFLDDVAAVKVPGRYYGTTTARQGIIRMDRRSIIDTASPFVAEAIKLFNDYHGTAYTIVDSF
jgi:hypothetical protein